MPLFTTLNSEVICTEIGEAREHVVLAATGITAAIADALIVPISTNC